jgi:pyruvate/2-oxoglutarate dehydrogenase complex dihydrolipoamide acyltransferase (E2) component
MSLRRKIAIATWGSPREGNIYGKVVVDARPALEYIQKLRETHGEHVTVTHLVTRALALTLKEPIDLNGYISFGQFIAHKTVDLSVVVAMNGGKNLSMVKLKKVDELSVLEIARQLNQRISEVRSGKDKNVKQSMSTAKWAPWFILKPLLSLVGWLSGSLGWSIPAFGLKAFPFGAGIITNVGVFGVDEAFVPPTPFARIPLYLLVGAIREAAYVDEGEVKARKEITLTATLDHRFVDGAQAAVLAQKLREAFAHPERIDLEPSTHDHPTSEDD